MNPLIYQFIYLWSYLLHVFPLTIQKTNSEVTKHIPQPGQGHTHLKKNLYHLCGGDNCSCFSLPRPHQWLPFTSGFFYFLSVIVCHFMFLKIEKCWWKSQNTSHGLARTSCMRTTHHLGSGSHGRSILESLGVDIQTMLSFYKSKYKGHF